MDMLLLGITVVSLIVAFVMSITAMRLLRDEKKRSAARVAALTLAASRAGEVSDTREAGDAREAADARATREALNTFADLPLEQPVRRAPWSAPRVVAAPVPLASPASPAEIGITHSSGFLGAGEMQREDGGRQKTLAFAAVVLFLVLSGGLAWMMSGPRGTTAQAMGPNAPLELMSLTHQRQNNKLAVSGLVRNPAAGKPIEKLSAVVFLFDKTGTFVTSSRAHVDFLKLGAGDESPFVVSLDAPATVARYRVSFRTDEGIVPHIDRRSATPTPVEGEQSLNVSVK
jgi:hypothetical protein